MSIERFAELPGAHMLLRYPFAATTVVKVGAVLVFRMSRRT